MDDACLDDDTSGDETEAERMSVSGDHHPLLASSEPGSSRFFQDSSISAARGREKSSLISHKISESDEIFSFFETKRPPPIPAKKTFSGNPQLSATMSNENKLEFRPQYDTIRAAKFRQINTGTLGSVGGFTRKSDDKNKMEGFNVKGTPGNLLQKTFMTQQGEGTFPLAVTLRAWSVWCVKKGITLAIALRPGLRWQ
jgi:hypothetical protein